MTLLPQFKGRSTRWWVALLLGLAIVGLGAGEVAARWLGVADLPLYHVDADGNFLPAPSQEGEFFIANKWAINERSLLVDEPFTPEAGDILLVGDSVVFGNIRFDQSERLGARLEAETGCDVWPLAAPGWSLRSELHVLQQQPGLLVPQTSVFVVNSEDFGPPSKWSDEFLHPREKPASALLFALRKKFTPRPDVPLPPEDPQWRTDFAAFSAAYPGRVLIIAWPKTDELESHTSAIPQFNGDIERLEIAAKPGWSPSFYSDSIHPDVVGTARLAALIAANLPQCTK